MEKYGGNSENKFNSKEFFEEVWKRMIECILLRSKKAGGGDPKSPFFNQHTMKPRFYEVCYYPKQYCECKKCLERLRQEEKEKEQQQEEEKRREQNSSNYMQIECEIARRKKEMEIIRSHKGNKRETQWKCKKGLLKGLFYIPRSL